jgi:hypothetical protein
MLSKVYIAVRVYDFSIRLTQSLMKVALEDEACLMNKLSRPVHSIIFESPYVNETICQAHHSLNSFVSLPLTFKNGTIFPAQEASSMPLATLKFSSVVSTFKLVGLET